MEPMRQGEQGGPGFRTVTTTGLAGWLAALMRAGPTVVAGPGPHWGVS